MSKVSAKEIQEQNEDEDWKRRTSQERLCDITESQVNKKVTRYGSIVREENDHSLT